MCQIEILSGTSYLFNHYEKQPSCNLLHVDQAQTAQSELTLGKGDLRLATVSDLIFPPGLAQKGLELSL